MKKRFYVYNSWKEQMELLSVEEKATMLMNLFAYQNDEEVVLDTPMLKMCWAGMTFLLEKDAKTYQQKVDNMKKIGKRNNKASNDTVTESNDNVKTLNDTVTINNDTVQPRLDNDNVNVNVNENVNVDDDGDDKVNDDGKDKDKEWFLKRLRNGIPFKTLNIKYPQSSSLTEAFDEYWNE